MIATTKNLYQKLQELEGKTNLEIIASQPARYVFWREAKKFANCDPEDLKQQALLMFLNEKKLQPKTGKFSRYLVAAIRHVVIKADKYMHRKKRFLPAMHFVYDEQGKAVEPKGHRAAILFNQEEVWQIECKIRERAKDRARGEFLLRILGAFLDGETASETARRIGVTVSKVNGARRSIAKAVS